MSEGPYLRQPTCRCARRRACPHGALALLSRRKSPCQPYAPEPAGHRVHSVPSLTHRIPLSSLAMLHQPFVTTSHGLDRQSPPMRLFEKAKRFGVWNPSDIDFRRDMQDWRQLRADEQ